MRIRVTFSLIYPLRNMKYLTLMSAEDYTLHKRLRAEIRLSASADQSTFIILHLIKNVLLITNIQSLE